MSKQMSHAVENQDNTIRAMLILSTAMSFIGALLIYNLALELGIISICFGIVFNLGAFIDIFKLKIKLDLFEAILFTISSLISLIILVFIGLFVCCFSGF